MPSKPAAPDYSPSHFIDGFRPSEVRFTIFSAPLGEVGLREYFVSDRTKLGTRSVKFLFVTRSLDEAVAFAAKKNRRAA